MYVVSLTTGLRIGGNNVVVTN